MKFTFPPESKPLDGYTIKRAIQRGGFGEVYYALSDGGKEVALKLLQQNMDIELRGVSRCLNLKHPNLVTIFDIRTDGDGDHWIVMEFVSGKSLDRVVDDQEGGMPLDEVQRWLSGIAAGLSFLHDRGIVHRDLKPGNVFQENGVVKIGDVGLAKFISQSRRDAQTQSVGTVYYMAPEVAHGRYGHEVDVYSLGCVLFELLTGRVPFDGESTAEILMKHLSEKPDLSPLPRRLRPVLARALEKDPLRRTPSATQVEEEFRQAVLGVDVASDIPAESFLPDANDENSWKKELKENKQRLKAEVKDFKKSYQTESYSPNGDGGNQKSYWWVYVVAIALFFSNPILFFLAVVMAVMGGGAALAYCVAAKSFGWQVPAFLLPVNRFLYSHSQPVSEKSSVEKTKSQDQAASPIFEEPDRKPVVAERPVSRPHRRRYQSEKLTPLTCRRISMRQRMTDMTASMTIAVLCTAFLTIAVMLLSPIYSNSYANSGQILSDAGRVGLFGLTCLLGSWGVLFCSKCVEGTSVASGNRRLITLLIGCAVGAAAFALNDFLLVEIIRDDFQLNPELEGLIRTLGPYEMRSGSQPTLVGYMVFFAGLFGLRRWWWHADSFRRYRFRLGSVMLTLMAGWLWAGIVGFPGVWGLSYAAAISCIVHLSSPCVPEEARPALMEKSNATV